MRESRNPISRWRILLQVVAEHSPSWGRWRGLPIEMEGANIKPYSLFHQYLLAITDIHTYGQAVQL